MDAYFFGCARHVWGHTTAGHHWYGPRGRSPKRGEPGVYQWAPNGVPWDTTIDSGLTPDPNHPTGPEGIFATHYLDGWTAISFWDRTGDQRGASNSTFVFDEILTPEAAVEKAREKFPELFERFTFELKPAPPRRRPPR